MRQLSCICLFLFFQVTLRAQYGTNSRYLKLSGGSVLFGTGDVPGFGVYIEGSGNFFRRSQYLSKHLQIGAELYFENGVKRPTIENPAPAQFQTDPFFKHISLSGLTIKSTFYPFINFLRGTNIGIGAGAAYYCYSYEARAVREVYTPTLSRRMSELRFENRFLVDYRLSAGYDFFIVRQIFLAGVRVDLVNYNNGDFNSLIGAKVGYRF